MLSSLQNVSTLENIKDTKKIDKCQSLLMELSKKQQDFEKKKKEIKHHITAYQRLQKR